MTTTNVNLMLSGLRTRQDRVSNSLLPLRMVASASFVLAIIFVLFFNLSKHAPALAGFNPFAEDPYALSLKQLRAGRQIMQMNVENDFRDSLI